MDEQRTLGRPLFRLGRVRGRVGGIVVSRRLGCLRRRDRAGRAGFEASAGLLNLVSDLERSDAESASLEGPVRESQRGQPDPDPAAAHKPVQERPKVVQNVVHRRPRRKFRSTANQAKVYTSLPL